MTVSNFSSLTGLELHLRTIQGRVGWVQSDYKAILVQLQLQLPAGTELGKNEDKPNTNTKITLELRENINSRHVKTLKE